MIGEMIVLTAKAHPELEGKLAEIKGEVTGNDNEKYLAVETEECIWSHNCREMCKNGHGWYVKVDSDQYEIGGGKKSIRLIPKNKDLLAQIRRNEIAKYNVKSNGALTIYSDLMNKRKLIINKSIKDRIMFYKCENDEDKEFILHVFEAFGIYKNNTINSEYKIVPYSESDEIAFELLLSGESMPVDSPEIKVTNEPIEISIDELRKMCMTAGINPRNTRNREKLNEMLKGVESSEPVIYKTEEEVLKSLGLK